MKGTVFHHVVSALEQVVSAAKIQFIEICCNYIFEFSTISKFKKEKFPRKLENSLTLAETMKGNTEYIKLFKYNQGR